MSLEPQYAKESKGNIVIKRRDGSSTTFSDAIDAAMEMWSELLNPNRADPWMG